MALTGRGFGRFHLIVLLLWTLSQYSVSSQVRQEFQVLEEQPIGTYVGTIETKPSFTYRFSENHKLFAINGTTGVIYTSSVIDREILQNESIVVSFKEDASSGRQVILDTATDSDIGSNGVDHTTYKIVKGNEQRKFRLDITVNPSGEGAFLHLVSTGGLDREVSPFYQLLVEVEDKGEPKKFGYLQVNVTIQDINDNPPIFDQDQYQTSVYEDAAVVDNGVPSLSGRTEATIKLVDVNDNDPVVKFRYFPTTSKFASVDENAQIGTVVALLTVSDSDSPTANGNISVSILGGNEQRHFEVHTSPVPNLSLIKVASVLDRERISSYNLTVSETLYRVDISEDIPKGSYIKGVSATDGDSGQNANLRYSLVSGNALGWFSISENSGLVTSAALLDREIASEIVLNISAKDQGLQPKMSYTKLIVNITDVNDQVPTFTQSTYHVSLVEHAPAGTELVVLSASDDDVGANGTIRFSFDAETPASVQELFRLDAVSGRLSTAAELDREDKASYLLHIHAADAGSPPLHSLGRVNITLRDINDNRPVFYPVQYFANVKENEPSGSFVTTVSATDPDLGRNGTLKYIISAGDASKFRINSNTGKISTLVSLDREEKTAYQLQVTAADGGGLRSDTQAIVTVTVIDTQDNPPVFSQNVYSFVMFENVGIGTVIGTVSATTVDLNTNISYLITSGDQRGLFAVNSAGQITASSQIDREEQGFYQLKVVARAGEITGEAFVNITVKDLNDNAPRFIHAVEHVSAVENWSTGHVIFQAKASDPDEGTNGVVAYSLKQNPKGLFHIHEKHGLITLTGPLEVTTSSYEVEVIASDIGIPQHTSSLILMKQRRGSLAGHVFAEDKDYGPNSEVRYTFETPQPNFELNAITGELTSTLQFDRELLMRQRGAAVFSFVVVSSDQGLPKPLRDQAKVQVYIQDINDNPPKFTKDIYQASISESALNMTQLLRVSASDVDENKNGLVHYYISEGNEEGQFTIDSGTGQPPTKQFPVEFRRFALKNVTIWVTDLNDNIPTFISQNALVAEPNIVTGSILTTVLAFDPDEGSNGEVEYELLEGDSDTFIMDRYSGDIRLASQLVQSRLMYILTVSATDHGSSRKTSRTELTIILQGLDGPVFSQPKYITILKEGQPPGTNVISLGASSPRGSATKVEYFIVAVRSEGKAVGRLFTIGRHTGVIQTAAELDREQGSDLYMVDVYAIETDASQPRTQRAEVSTRLTFLFSTEVSDWHSSRYTFVNSGLKGQERGRVAVPCQVEITLQDVNDNPPVFPNDILDVTIEENVGDGFKIMQLTATDADKFILHHRDHSRLVKGSIFSCIGQDMDIKSCSESNPGPVGISEVCGASPKPKDTVEENGKSQGPNALVTYTIISGADDSFRIDPESGDLIATKKLDRERRSKYSLLVRADDGKQSSDMRLNITVKDLNDHTPKFSRATYSFDIPEDMASGSIVAAILASDSDSGVNGEVTYSLEDDDEDETFRLNPVTGVFNVTRPLDYETQRFYILTAKARDGGGQASTVRVYFNVLDVNDNPPVFNTSSYSSSVSESLPPGSSIVTVGASDEDDGPNAQLLYRIASGDPQSHFVITKEGVLQTKKALDRETQSFYNLVVTVNDLAPPPMARFTSTAQVSIILLDINDCPPAFTSQRKTYIQENTPVDTVVFTAKATDADSGPNSYVEYSMKGPFGNKFSIGTIDGDVRLVGELDREELSNYTLTVVATDKGEPALSSTMDVTMMVLDVNDNTPSFSQNIYDIEIEENTLTGTDVIQVFASDADEGTNGQIRFSISGGNTNSDFRIDSVTGVISVAKQLDREARSSYSLVVQAADRGSSPRVDRTTVNIVLLDVNDCSPVFELSPYTVNVLENSENLPQKILQVVARDDDQSANGQLSYMLSGGNDEGAFSLSSSGQLRLTQTLDREAQGKYILLITAADSAGAMCLGIVLTVLLPPGMCPVLSLKRPCVVVRASSGCIDTHDHIAPYCHAVCIWPFSCWISPPRGSLSAERPRNSCGGQKTDHLIVMYLDPLRFRKYGHATFLEFERTPDDVAGSAQGQREERQGAFERDLVPDALGDRPIRSKVKQVVAAAVEQVFLQCSSFSSAIDLNPAPGASEPVSSPALRENGNPSLSGTGTVTVLVDDVNDNVPVFTASAFHTTIMENAPTGADVLLVNSSDADVGVNGVISYSLTGGHGQFSINPATGQIITSSLLDREDRANYQLLVVATDGGQPEGLSSSATVSVTVSDINDNPPRFHHHPYVTHIPASTAAGSLVFAVTVTDEDSSSNAQLHYSLIGRNSEKFKIDPVRGAITAIEKLTGNTEVTLTVRVKDGGTNPKTDTTTVTVRFVTGGNFPVIKLKERAFTFPESQATNHVVTTVTGSSMRGGPLSYYISSGNLDNAFHIDQQSGEVSIRHPLDYEHIQKYVLWIEARDQGFPPYSTYEKVEITVLDVNDNHPVFDKDPFHAEILESLSPQRVLIVSAVDLDSGPNGQLEYAIIDGNKENSFNINRATGEIRSTRPLDREKVAQYALKVKATDRGLPSKNSAVKVIINVLDVNDNAPRFSKIFSATVAENAPVGYTVTRVTTTDEDAGSNAVSKYSITDSSLPFNINPNTGDITISRPLNREDTDHYIVKVSAHDSGWTVSTDVTVFITDINDNAPRFSRPSYYLDHPELTEVGSLVTRVSATDPDEGFNGKIFYFIRSQSEFFRINSSTGEIFVKQQLRYQNSTGASSININRHSFIVTASDRAVTPLMSETTVIVNIVDSNDNPPEFDSPSYFTPVTKSVKVGTRLIRVVAHDEKDFGLNSVVEYLITGGNSSSKFKLDKTGGWITVASSLTSDMNKVFLIDITASDRGNPPLSARTTVRIAVTEENHHTPEFSQSQISASVSESLVVGTAIRTLSARDKDKDTNGLIAYNITSGNDKGLFSLNSKTGLLSLALPLDFEEKQQHELRVSATDGGWISKTSYVTVTVHVTDVNDNPPVFDPEEYFPIVQENVPSGTTVVKLNATDRDSGANAVMAYVIQSSDSDLFVIDPNTGTITTQGFLDYEAKQVYHLTVKAFNVPDEERCSFANVNIQLKGANEYVPRFVSKQYYFEISEAAPKGTVVGEVFASDRDQGDDGVVYYLIFGRSRKKGFGINKKTGQIYVTGSLDREKDEKISLKVLAKNAGSIRGADIDEVLVNITILDANDPPSLPKNSMMCRSAKVSHLEVL
ncbi:hypothetical protein KUCAC02_004049 [Chaenocephalus aceratus]|uniref:Uncharacterized protein n=1 Tax=Chaenocephalus aceratus TaxID=36190 RepID=A0ACB9WXJ9_CHAAC|nr:hypothetical protein KUCAC02_004049 [Chaenocephalus aceratus]